MKQTQTEISVFVKKEDFALLNLKISKLSKKFEIVLIFQSARLQEKGRKYRLCLHFKNILCII